MKRSIRTLLLLAATLQAACAGAARENAWRELQAGDDGGYGQPLTVEVRTPGQYRHLAESLHHQYPDCTFPQSPPEIDWKREMLVAILAGDSEAGTKIQIVQMTPFDRGMLVQWSRIPPPEIPRTGTEEVLSIPRPPRPRTRPFSVVAMPVVEGTVRFVQARPLLYPDH
jgi:hypothetical protein